MDIGTEELSHLEIVGTLARMHLKPLKSVREEAEADPLIAIAGGGGVSLFNSMGSAWTADYLKITGELDVDLRSNIAAEARAKIVYERLINFCRDAGSKDALQFLMTREITHMRAFTLALDSMGRPPFSIGKIAPTPGLVDQFFNDSTGEGEQGEVDARGPWNEGEPWHFIESPVIQGFNGDGGEGIHAESSGAQNIAAIRELVVDQLQDILSAEKQLLKALPKMAKAARSANLESVFVSHLKETETQAKRLEDCLKALGARSRAKQCKGMAGLIEEGDEVMAEGREKNDAPADLALIGAALRVEHYEIAAYTTARNLALQLREPTIVQMLTTSLGEEQNAGQLLDQVAQPLLSVSRMPASVQ
jgi:Mn-containing catalase